MTKGIALALTVFVGAAVALQAPINATLGRATGTFHAAFISFLVGTVALLGVMVIAGGFTPLKGITDVSWVYLTGGLLGMAYVVTVIVTVRHLGAGGVAAATITGMLTTAVVIDKLGILNLEKIPITWPRVLGVALLVVGTLLVVRD